MRVLVIGGGGREHALVWKISQSPKVTEVFCAPGNAGTATIANNVPIAADQIDQLLEFAQENEIGLTMTADFWSECPRRRAGREQSVLQKYHGKIQPAHSGIRNIYFA